MVKTGIWIANEKNRTYADDYFFWIRDMIQNAIPNCDEVFIFGHEDQTAHVKEYILDSLEGKKTANFYNVPTRTTFEKKIAGYHWRSFRIYDESKKMVDRYRNSKWQTSAAILVGVFSVLMWVGKFLMDCLKTMDRPRWLNRLRNLATQKRLDCLIVPDVTMHSWVGIECKVISWDSSFSNEQLNFDMDRPLLVKALGEYSKVIISDVEIAKILNRLAGKNLKYEVIEFPIRNTYFSNFSESDKKIKNLLLSEYIRNNNFYFPDLELGRIPYVVCTTKDNNYDAVINLILAFSHLIKERRINGKLVFISEPGQKVIDVITQLGLFLDVLWFGNASPEDVIALVAKSRCVVEPTQIHNGFPYTAFLASAASVPYCIAKSDWLSKKSDFSKIRELVFDNSSVDDIANVLEMSFKNGIQYVGKQNEFLFNKRKDSWTEFYSILLSKDLHG